MTDSTHVFPTGWKLLDSDGNPISGGTVYFYEAGTTTPLTVYSDADLSTTIGTSIATNSAGEPVSDGNPVLVYTGTDPYKVIAKDASAVTMWTYDNVNGAVDTSAFLTADDVTTQFIYETSSLTSSGTWVAANVLNQVFYADPSGGSITRTLPVASTCEGYAFDVVHVGTANLITILTQGSEVIKADGRDTARKAVLLASKGDSIRLASDGVNWIAYEHVAAPLVRHFAVESIISSPVGSPVTGGYYLISGTPGGSFTSTTPACADGDVVMYDGQSNYQIFRPSTDCAWTIYDKDTSVFKQYRGSAWADMAATDTALGLTQYATQSDMETATSNVLAVTPGRMQYHPGVAKAWVNFTGTGTVAINASHNVSSVTDNGTGDYTINFTNALSSANYGLAGAARYGTGSTDGGVVSIHNTVAPTASACRVFCLRVAATSSNLDLANVYVVFFGDM